METTTKRNALNFQVARTRTINTNEKGEIENVSESWDVDTGNGRCVSASDLVDAIAKIVKSLPLNDTGMAQLINEIQKK